MALVGLGHSAGTRTLALGHFSSTGIPWCHRDTPMGLKYTLVGLGHYRAPCLGLGHCHWYMSPTTPMELGHHGVT